MIFPSAERLGVEIWGIVTERFIFQFLQKKKRLRVVFENS
jgi:hypothetical protein